MTSVTVELRNVHGTETAMGWAGGHTVVVDRPPGKAGGMGLGFNGAQLLALAVGGCLCNDLRYTAHAMGLRLTSVEVSVTLAMEGDPLFATSVEVQVGCETEDGSDPAAVIERAKAITMVGNGLNRGVPVTIRSASRR